MKGRLNLASQRQRNERLPTLLLSVGCVALLALSAVHGLQIRRLLPRQSSALSREVADLETELARLRRESSELKSGPRPDKDRIDEWRLVKELVDRRVFRWTRLFARLADTLPEDVRLTSIAPTLEKGAVTLDLDAAARSLDAGLAFIKVLEDRPEFADVYPKGGVRTSPTGEEEFTYTMRYLDADAPPASGAGR